MTTTPTVAPPAPVPSFEKLTVVLAPTAFLIAASTVVPPVVTSPLLPCQSMVQPPHWFPISSALWPAIWIRAAVFANGRTFLSFLHNTNHSRTASLATLPCWAEPQGFSIPRPALSHRLP